MKITHYIGLSLLLSSCAVLRAPSLRMLDERAEYDRLNDIRLSLPQDGLGRSKALVSDVFIHPHELPNGDYFLGGWIRTVLSDAHWKRSKAVRKAKKK